MREDASLLVGLWRQGGGYLFVEVCFFNASTYCVHDALETFEVLPIWLVVSDFVHVISLWLV